MACAIHGQSALCDETCAGFLQGASEPAQQQQQAARLWDPAKAEPPFESYEQMLDAWRAQYGAVAPPPSEDFAREQGWLTDNEKADAGTSE